MKKTDKETLKSLSVRELAEKVEMFRRELFSLRLHSATSPVKDHQQFKRLRRNIACAITYLNQKTAQDQ